MPTITQEAIWFIASIALGAVGVALLLFWHELRTAIARNEQWNWTKVFVQAAEQLFAEEGAGSQRLDWVMVQLKARYPQLDTTIARAMIEAVVNGLNAMPGRR